MSRSLDIVLFAHGHPVDVATHDPVLIEQAGAEVPLGTLAA